MNPAPPITRRALVQRTLDWIVPVSGTPIQMWRQRILAAVLVGVGLFGVLAYVPGVWIAARDGERTVVIVDTIALALVLVVLAWRRLAYTVRALVIVLLPAGLGTYYIAAFGVEAAGFPWLMAFPIMAAVLIGLRSGIAALVAMLVILLVIGVQAAHHTLPWVLQDPSAFSMYIVNASSVTLIATMATLSFGVLSRGLGDEATARAAAEQESARLAGAVNQSEGLVLLVDTAGDVTYANEMARQLLEAHLVFASLPQWASVLAGEPWAGALDLPRAGAEGVMLSGTMSPVRDDAGRITHVLATLRDVSRERALEARLQQGQRLEAIGTLAGGIAHDFNNLLQPIALNTEFVQARLAPDDASQPVLQDIKQAAERASALVRRILAFTRGTEPDRQPVDVGALLRDTERMLRTTLPAGVTLTCHASPGVIVMADVGELQQVLLNLASNAVHAMPDGGTLELSATVLQTIDDIEVHTAFAGVARVACLTVRDTGAGMDAATLSRAFDPFFTTKGPQRGTGLGLAMVHGTITALGGIILPRSSPGRGTTMRVMLPLERMQPEVPAEEPESAPSTGVWRVLVVDDEPFVLAAITRLLERLGWSVDAYADPADAIRHACAPDAHYDCVITDFSMPGLSGLQLAQRIHAERPTLPIVLSTGYLEHDTLISTPGSGISHILPKPFSARELRRVLDAVRGASREA